MNLKVPVWKQCLIILGLCISWTSAAAPWEAIDFPNPYSESQACGRGDVKSWICDPDGILSVREANVVEGMLKDIALARDPYPKSECGTDDIPGFQIAVAIMKSMKSTWSTDEAGYQFAKTVHDAWGVGHAKCNDGIVLVVSIDDRIMGISTGRGVKDRIDEENILNEMKPFFRQREYATGVRKGVHEIGKDLNKEWADSIPEYFIPIGFFATVAVCIGFSTLRSRKTKSIKQKLEMLKKSETAVRNGTYETTSCPICFEEFDDPKKKKGSSGNHRDDSEDDNDDLDAYPPLLLNRRKQEAQGHLKAATDSKKYPITLRCGHTFCESCLLEWLDHNTTCPICRESIPEIGDPSFPSTYGYGSTQWNTTTWGPEMNYRLNRLGYMYPGYVTPSMIDMWYMDYRLGRNFDYRGHQDFKSWDPAQNASEHARLGHSGQSGAAGGFGGGGGGGGGGASSSW